jgi:hypothetical protein
MMRSTRHDGLTPPAGTPGRELHDVLMQLPGVSAHEHQLGGVEYRVGDVEIGHVHRHVSADVDAGAALARAVVRRGLAEVNPYAPDGWLTIDLAGSGGLRVARWLFLRNHRRIGAHGRLPSAG